MDSIERIAQKLKERTKSEEQYDFVEEEGNAIFRRSQVLISQYRKAHQLQDMLLNEYKGADLCDLVHSTVVTNEYGEVLHKNEEVNITLPNIGCKERILHDLKLIHGIGPVKERKLKAKGYETLHDLQHHEKWGTQADSLLRTCFPQPKQLLDKIARMKSASDPLTLEIADFYDPSDFVILDIETMGMSNQPVILLGVGFPTTNKLTVHQFLLKDIDQEVAALQAFSKKIADKKVFLTYNGKSFDIPYINRRLRFYGLPSHSPPVHLDLLHFSRRAWGDDLRNCGLNRVERQILNLHRSVDIPSALVPEFYQTYRDTNNPGPLLPILEHNKQDLLTLLNLFQKIYQVLSKKLKREESSQDQNLEGPSSSPP